MIPKEKAKELYWKYYQNVSDTSFPEETAKQCALISIDEILKRIVPKDDDERYVFELCGNQFYWQEVKQEIKKI